MFYNNFGYYTNMLSRAMMPNFMMQNMLMGGMGGMYGGYSPLSLFSNYSCMPNFSFMPQMPFMMPSYPMQMPYLNYALNGGGVSSSTNYFDFLNYRPTVTYGNIGKTDIVDVNIDANGKKLSPYAAFEKMCDVAEDLGYEKSKTHKDEKHGVLMVDEQWREDANAKKDGVETRYMELVKNFGKSFIRDIDKKYGDGNGQLTYAEFEKYQMEDIPSDADAETKKAMKASIKIAYDRLNLNGGDTIDEKEMTALLASMDYDKNNNVNGRITVDDYTKWSALLAEKDKNDLDTLLKSRYDAFFDTKA